MKMIQFLFPIRSALDGKVDIASGFLSIILLAKLIITSKNNSLLYLYIG